MTNNEQGNWLLLIHQIPPKPNALRVKIWRRLQQVGAVAIKQTVYVMPLTEQSREDLSWILKEIIEGGGEGTISEARFVQGLTDEQIISLFQSARKVDYENLIQEANALLADWSSGESDPRDATTKAFTQLSRLQRRLDEIAAIDFFETAERGTAELLLKELRNQLSGRSSVEVTTNERIGKLIGKIWVTRANLFVDRIACGWLIRRFIDKEADFKFVSDPDYSAKPGEIRFDMFDGEFTHVGSQCTFEVMIERLQLEDHALVSMAEIVHDIDLKDGKHERSETGGFNALLSGLVALYQDDDQRMNDGYCLFDTLYTYFHRHKKE